MRLYTEEQLDKAMDFARGYHRMSDTQFIETLTPIELPTDEEIEEFSYAKYMEVEDSRWFEPLKVGAKWMRDKIGGNK